MRFLAAAFVSLNLLAAVGCGDARPQAPEPARPVELGARFHADTARTISGRVIWAGELPLIPPLKIQFNGDSSAALKEALERPNPNAPAIDPHTRGIGNAVVFLRGIDARQSRPWDLPPVTVEIRGRQHHVIQGATDTPIGFVRKGETITMVSRETECHALHARRGLLHPRLPRSQSAADAPPR